MLLQMTLINPYTHTYFKCAEVYGTISQANVLFDGRDLNIQQSRRALEGDCLSYYRIFRSRVNGHGARKDIGLACASRLF